MPAVKYEHFQQYLVGGRGGPVGENQCEFLHKPAASGVNLIVWIIYGSVDLHHI